MATDAENLATIKSQIIQQIKDVTANPKPTYTIRNQTVQWQQHLDSLWAKLEKIDAMVAANAGTTEIESFGY